MPSVRILFLAAWATLSVVPTGLAAPPVSADLASALPDVAEQAVQSVVNVSTRRRG
jgi:hypothetical protein